MYEEFNDQQREEGVSERPIDEMMRRRALKRYAIAIHSLNAVSTLSTPFQRDFNTV